MFIPVSEGAWVRGMEPQEQTLMRTKKTSQRLDMREGLGPLQVCELEVLQVEIVMCWRRHVHAKPARV